MIRGSIASILVLMCAQSAHAQSISADDFLTSLNRYLTKQWGMIPVGLSGDQSFVKVGALYSYDRPDDYCKLIKLSGGSKKVDLSLFDENGLSNLPLATSSEIQRYTVQETLAKHLAADLSTHIGRGAASALVLRDRLKNASISFTVSRYFIPAKLLIASIQSYDVGPLDPSMKGIIGLSQVLVLKDFRYNEQSASQVSGGFNLSLLDLIKTKFSGSSDGTTTTEISFPSKMVVAFRPISVAPRLARACR